MLESFLIKLQVLRTATLLKRDSNTGILQWILWIVQKHLFCVEDVWAAGSETPVRLFKNTFFKEHLQWLLLTVSSFLLPTLLKKRLWQRCFFCEFCKFFKNIFWQKTSGWLLLVFICEFWEVFQITSSIEHLWETAYFIYKLPNLKHHIQ